MIVVALLDPLEGVEKIFSKYFNPINFKSFKNDWYKFDDVDTIY